MSRNSWTEPSQNPNSPLGLLYESTSYLKIVRSGISVVAESTLIDVMCYSYDWLFF